MYIVMVAPECSPAIQVGGLADVVSGLARELEVRGNAVEIILPKFNSMRYDRIHSLTVDYGDLWVPWYDGAIHCTVFFGFVNGRKCFFIEPHSRDNFFHRPHPYGYDDDVLRYAFFSKAALEFLLKAQKRPDVIHCHDWQTALVPVLLFEIYKHQGMTNQRVCLTVHNFGHQGVIGPELLRSTGLNRPEYYFHPDRMQDNIPRHYSADSLDHKYANKLALRQSFWLREGHKPLVAYVGRLDRQKGVHLVRHALYYALRNGGQFVLLGPSPDPSIAGEFHRIKGQLNDNPDCHLELNFDPELAHLVYAGADMIVMPSFYEPCGMVQMIALKYGTVPIVRNVGGLAETVHDRDYSGNGNGSRNGYVFNDADYAGIESAMHRAFGLWHHYPLEFRDLMANGMRHDHSWNHAGQDYLNIYEYIRHK